MSIAGEQLRRHVDLGLGRQPGVEHARRSPPRAREIVSSRLEERIGASSDQRRDDPDVADREQPGGVARGCARASALPPAPAAPAPSPRPRGAAGTTVHQAEAEGSSARQLMPARDQQAARRGARLGVAADREAANAAAGSTLTASAAASGSMLQPATSSSTTRKTTAVSAADSSPSAIAGRTGMRRRARPPQPPSAAASDPVPRAAREAGEHAGEHDRRLRQEDRPPVEQLGERAAQRRADRGAEHRGGHPEPAPRLRGCHRRAGRSSATSAAAPPSA